MRPQLQWRIRVCESELEPVVKYVALVIDTFSDRRGFGWPSYEAIAARAGVDRRTVIRAVGRLERAGLLLVVRSSGRRSNRYQTTPSNSVSPDTVNSVSGVTVNSVSPDTPYRLPLHPQQCLRGGPTVSGQTPEAVEAVKREVEADTVFDKLKTQIKNGALWQPLDLELELDASGLDEERKAELRRQAANR